MVKEHQKSAPEYAQLVEEYEEQKTPEARFVRVIDKLMVLIIHIPNDGAVLKEHFPAEVLGPHRQRVRVRMLDQYPEFSRMIELDEELTKYLTSLYLSNNF